MDLSRGLGDVYKRQELATLILDEVEVAAVPGEAFGPSGYLRFSYATSDEDIVEGIGRVKKLLSEAI
jgi:aspartate aminotransferase